MPGLYRARDCAKRPVEKKARKMMATTRVNLIIAVIFIPEWPSQQPAPPVWLQKPG
jgi:hypothetical protein